MGPKPKGKKKLAAYKSRQRSLRNTYKTMKKRQGESTANFKKRKAVVKTRAATGSSPPR